MCQGPAGTVLRCLLLLPAVPSLYVSKKQIEKSESFQKRARSQALGPSDEVEEGPGSIATMCVVKIRSISSLLRPRVRSDPNLLCCCIGSLEVGIHCQLLLQWEHRKAR